MRTQTGGPIRLDFEFFGFGAPLHKIQVYGLYTLKYCH